MVVALDRLQVQRPAAREHPPVLQRELVGRVDPEPVAAACASSIIRKVVSVSMLIRLDGVHLDGDVQGHSDGSRAAPVT